MYEIAACGQYMKLREKENVRIDFIVNVKRREFTRGLDQKVLDAEKHCGCDVLCNKCLHRN